MSKYKVGNVESVECPYCKMEKGESKLFQYIHWKHLKALHSKTMDDLKVEYPDCITMTEKESHTEKTIICSNEKCKKSFTSRIYSNQKYCKNCRKEFNKKDLKCHYCGNIVKVPKNMKFAICNKCKAEGKINPDKLRTKRANCFNCNKEFDVQIRSSNKYPICKECKNKGIKNPFAQKTGKMGIEKLQEKYNVNSPMEVDEFREKHSEVMSEIFKDEKRKEEIINKREENYYEKTGYKYRHHMHNPEIQEKVKKSTNESLGVNYPLQNKDCLEKMKNTNIADLGVEWGFQNKEIREKGKLTSINKYGHDSWSKSDEGKKVLRDIGLKRYEKDRIKKLEERKFELADKEYIHAHHIHMWKCKVCNKFFEVPYAVISQGYLCPFCYPRENGSSIPEKLLYEFIDSIIPNEYVLKNKRTIIPPAELDLYYPHKKIAIEYDGFYYHNESNYGKEKHLKKLEECTKKGITLIHIFEDEWIEKEELVKNRISQLFGADNRIVIPLELCEIKLISNEVSNIFLNEHHIKGLTKTSINFGLIYNGNLVSIMTFLKRSDKNNPKNQIFEMNRFCNHSKFKIYGSAEMLFKMFTDNYEWNSIFVIADRRWSDGKLYENLGFKLHSISEPKKGLIYGCKRFSSYEDMRNGLTPRILKRFEGIEIKHDFIWDCGYFRYLIQK